MNRNLEKRRKVKRKTKKVKRNLKRRKRKVKRKRKRRIVRGPEELLNVLT